MVSGAPRHGGLHGGLAWFCRSHARDGASDFHESWKHQIIECFGLEGTFRVHLAQPRCSEQGHLKLDQAAQSPGWGRGPDPADM